MVSIGGVRDMGTTDWLMDEFHGVKNHSLRLGDLRVGFVVHRVAILGRLLGRVRLLCSVVNTKQENVKLSDPR